MPTALETVCLQLPSFQSVAPRTCAVDADVFTVRTAGAIDPSAALQAAGTLGARQFADQDGACSGPKRRVAMPLLHSATIAQVELAAHCAGLHNAEAVIAHLSRSGGMLRQLANDFRPPVYAADLRSSAPPCSPPPHRAPDAVDQHLQPPSIPGLVDKPNFRDCLIAGQGLQPACASALLMRKRRALQACAHSRER